MTTPKKKKRRYPQELLLMNDCPNCGQEVNVEFVQGVIDTIVACARKETTELSHPCKGCGEHQSIAGALLKSDYWKRWYKHASQANIFDVDETQEIDAMSDEHFGAFMQFCKK